MNSLRKTIFGFMLVPSINNTMPRKTALTAAISLICSNLAFSEDINFIGVSGTNWVSPNAWEGGSYPTVNDFAVLDSVSSLDTPSPNNLRGIRVGSRSEGVMNVTFDGSLNAAAVNTVSQIGSGSGNEGSVEQTNGAVNVNVLEIGSNSAVGTYNLNRGTLTIVRRSQNNSLYIGTDASKTSSGLGTLSITAGSISTRGEAYLGSPNGGIGIFEVIGSDSAQIGIGSNNNIDGAWTQNAGSILRVKIDRTPVGVTSILIDDAENDGAGGDVIFENGALLDVDFQSNYMNGGTFTVMEWEGELTDNGLQFAPSVDRNIWSFDLDTQNKRLTVTANGSPFVREFVHPGISHKRSDLERMRDMVNAGIEPWASSFEDFRTNRFANFDANISTSGSPLTILEFGDYNNFRNNCLTAYYNALMWVITEDSRHADKVVEILNTWSRLTEVQDRIPLDLGRAVLHLVEAAEIIKHTYDGWDDQDILRFSDMLVYPGYSNSVRPSGPTTFYWDMMNGDPARAGNQGLFAMRAVLGIAIFLDNEIMYDRVLRLSRGATNRTDDFPYPTGPPVNGDPTAIHEYAIQWGQNSRDTDIADYGYNELISNYVFENGQNEESSRDQVHGAVGLINLTTICETAWSQGDDLYGHLNNRPLTGWEFWARYNLSFTNSFSDQPTPWEPSVESGEYFQRLTRTGRRLPLKINPFVDGNEGNLTRGEVNDEPVYEINLAHYRDRMGISGEDIKWLERGHEVIEEEQGFEDEANNVFSMTGWGGMRFRRVSPGDPIQGFTNGVPNFAMNSLPLTIEAENYDYFPLDGQGLTYFDQSETTNTGSSFRSTEGVDVSPTSEGDFAISSIESGEWLTYTVSAPETGLYALEIRYASTASGGTIQFSSDNIALTGEVEIPHGGSASNGASDWQNLLIATDIPLSQGVQQLRVNFSGTSNAFLLDSISMTGPVPPFLVSTTQSETPPAVSNTDLAQTQFLSSSATGGQQSSEHATLFNGMIGNQDGDDDDSGEVRLDRANTITVTFDTSLNTAGYDLTEITTTFGGNPSANGRSNQGYEIIVHYVDGDSAILAGPEHWEPNNPASYWTTVSFTPGNPANVLASGVEAVTFDIANNANAGNWVIAREFDIFGTPTPGGHTALEAWRFANFGIFENEGDAADDADADLDGLSNLIEYATGLDPNDSGDSQVLEIRNSLSVPDSLELAFNSITDPSLTYLIQGSSNLLDDDWVLIAATTGRINGTVNIPESSWPDEETYFFRLLVSY